MDRGADPLTRPAVAPQLLAGVLERLPARLRRRLEQRRDLARDWQWSTEGGGVVVATGAATVRVGPGAASLDQVSCDCLLAPRCLHLAAVLLALPLALDDPEAEVEPAASAGDLVPVTPAARAAAEAAWHAGALLLDIGAASAGLVVQGELLRAAHACRLAGLHRAAAALTRAAQRLSELHASRPEYRLDFLLGDVSDALTSALAVATAAGPVPRSAVGVARRAYAAVGSLRLTGIFSEAVMSAAGYAGVVTYLADGEGRLWTVADVAPGGPERVAAAYGAPVEVGDLALSHHGLGRSSVYVQRATGSLDGRLGTGRGVGAVRSGPTTWDAGPWERPPPDQLDAVFEALALDQGLRRAGWDLLFLDGVVLGVRQAALVLSTAAGEVSCYAPSDHEELPYRRNLRLLGAAPGLPLRVVGRVLTQRARSLALLAVGPDTAPGDQAPALALPAEWLGRANLGVDVLQSAHVTRGERAPVELPVPLAAAAPDPLDPLARRLGQALTGGRVTQAESAWADIDRDAALLRRRQLPGAAARLETMRAASLRGVPDARRRFALAWTAARTYQVAARDRLGRTSWS
jgi:SWIM zinc finger